MIRRTLIPLTILLGFLTLMPLGEVYPPAHSAVPKSGPDLAEPIVVAKKTKQSPRRSSPLTVNNVRYHAHKKYTRVVLDLPARAVIRESKNAKNSTATITLAKSRLSKRALKKIQSRKFPNAITISEGASQTVTLTLDLTVMKKYALQTLRKPNRVVVDLYYFKGKRGVASKKITRPQATAKKSSSALRSSKKKKVITKSPAEAEPPKTPKKHTATTKPALPTPKQEKTKETDQTKTATSSSPASVARQIKDLVVVIDPGHGGKDPGATGKRGTKEKHITLKIGKYLKDLVQKRLGSTVLMTRDKDIFLDLEKRVEFANKKKADIFISIHVNSHPQKKIKGLEVYHFGKASDPRALEVAARENGMKLEDNAPPWQFIIADKLNDQKIEQSQTFAWTTNKTLVKALKSSYKVKDHGVKTAPFYVLRFTTMPSILAEVAFVSNPEEEKRLRSQAFQKQLAEGMYQAIHSYLKTAFPTIS